MAAWAVLREARAQACLSQRALAARTGIAQSEIARIESGKQEPSFERLSRLVRGAGFDLKIELVPRDEHDARLIRSVLSLGPEERLDSLDAVGDFFADAPALRPRLLFAALVRHQVRFVILGGVAERLLGSPRMTDDVDICPATGRANLERLAAMLNDIDALSAEPWSARSFASQTSLSLLTAFGSFDVWLRPDGTEGYRDLIRKAVDVEIGGQPAKVVHPDDSIRIKRAIGGPKYLSHLPLLREVQEERRARGLD